MSKFNRYQGALSLRQYNHAMNQTNYCPTTKDDLYKFLVLGTPLTVFIRTRRQFLRNKLVDLETRGLI